MDSAETTPDPGTPLEAAEAQPVRRGLAETTRRYASRWTKPSIVLGVIALAGFRWESVWLFAAGVAATATGVLALREIQRYCQPGSGYTASRLPPAVGLGLGALVTLVYALYLIPTSNRRLLERAAHSPSVFSVGFNSQAAREASEAREELVSRGRWAVGALVAGLEDEGSVGATAATLLEEIGDPATSALLDVLEDGTESQRAYACMFFLGRRDQRAIARLLSVAQAATPSSTLQTMAHLTLYGLSDEDPTLTLRHGDAETALYGLRYGVPLTEIMGRARREFPLDQVPAWLEAQRAVLPEQY